MTDSYLLKMNRKVLSSGIINTIALLFGIVTFALFKLEIEKYIFGLIGFNIWLLVCILVNSFFVIHFLGTKEFQNAFMILFMTILAVMISFVVIGHVPALAV